MFQTRKTNDIPDDESEVEPLSAESVPTERQVLNLGILTQNEQLIKDELRRRGLNIPYLPHTELCDDLQSSCGVTVRGITPFIPVDHASTTSIHVHPEMAKESFEITSDFDRSEELSSKIQARIEEWKLSNIGVDSSPATGDGREDLEYSALDPEGSSHSGTELKATDKQVSSLGVLTHNAQLIKNELRRRGLNIPNFPSAVSNTELCDDIQSSRGVAVRIMTPCIPVDLDAPTRIQTHPEVDRDMLKQDGDIASVEEQLRNVCERLGQWKQSARIYSNYDTQLQDMSEDAHEARIAVPSHEDIFKPADPESSGSEHAGPEKEKDIYESDSEHGSVTKSEILAAKRKISVKQDTQVDTTEWVSQSKSESDPVSGTFIQERDISRPEHTSGWHVMESAKDKYDSHPASTSGLMSLRQRRYKRMIHPSLTRPSSSQQDMDLNVIPAHVWTRVAEEWIRDVCWESEGEDAALLYMTGVSVKRLSVTGQPLALSLDTTHMSKPWSVSCSGDGEWTVVTDCVSPGSWTAYKRQAPGVYQRHRTHPVDGKPRSVRVTPQGRLAVLVHKDEPVLQLYSSITDPQQLWDRPGSVSVFPWHLTPGVMSVSTDGDILVCGRECVDQYSATDGTHVTTLHYLDRLRGPSAVCADPSGRVWVGCGDGSVWLITNTGGRKVIDGGGGWVRSLAVHGNTQLAVGTMRGLHLYKMQLSFPGLPSPSTDLPSKGKNISDTTKWVPLSPYETDRVSDRFIQRRDLSRPKHSSGWRAMKSSTIPADMGIRVAEEWICDMCYESEGEDAALLYTTWELVRRVSVTRELLTLSLDTTHLSWPWSVSCSGDGEWAVVTDGVSPGSWTTYHREAPGVYQLHSTQAVDGAPLSIRVTPQGRLAVIVHKDESVLRLYSSIKDPQQLWERPLSLWYQTPRGMSVSIDGDILVCGMKGVDQYSATDGTHLTTLHYPDRLWGPRSVCADPSGRVWVGCEDGSVWLITNTGGRKVIDGGGGWVESLAVHGNTQLAMGTVRGLDLYKFTSEPDETSSTSPKSSRKLTSLPKYKRSIPGLKGRDVSKNVLSLPHSSPPSTDLPGSGEKTSVRPRHRTGPSDSDTQ